MAYLGLYPRKMAAGGSVADLPPLARPWNETAFERELAARGLQGPAPFSWGSEGSLNLADPRLTDAQRAAILEARDVATTPSVPSVPTISNTDAARFLQQTGQL